MGASWEGVETELVITLGKNTRSKSGLVHRNFVDLAVFSAFSANFLAGSFFRQLRQLRRVGCAVCSADSGNAFLSLFFFRWTPLGGTSGWGACVYPRPCARF